MTTRNEEILKAAHELECLENVPYFVNGAEWADKHPSKESLRPHWKPSDEQMGVIAQAIAVLKVSGYDELGDRLGDISEQLNKLKEE